MGSEEFGERIARSAKNALTVFAAQMMANGEEGEQWEAVVVFASPDLGVGCCGTAESGYMTCHILAQAIAATSGVELHRMAELEGMIDGDARAE